MSFYPIQSSYHATDDLHCCDDLDVLEEDDTDSQEERDDDDDNQQQHAEHDHRSDSKQPTRKAEEEHKEAVSPLSPAAPFSSPAPPAPAVHVSSAFPFHSPFPSHSHQVHPHHRKQKSSSVCSLPASPVDASSEHNSTPHRRPHRADRRRTADPSTLFLLHRIMKGDVFTMYTVASSSSVLSRPVFVFYDAHHGRLGSLFWTEQRKATPGQQGKRTFELQEDRESSASAVVEYERAQAASQCLPVHQLRFVQAGKTEELKAGLVTSLPSSCFLALHGVSQSLLLSHLQPSVARQWLACLKDIFLQHDCDVRMADDDDDAADGKDRLHQHREAAPAREGGEGGEQAAATGSKQGSLQLGAGGKAASALMAAFVDPSEEANGGSEGDEAAMLSLRLGGGVGSHRASLSIASMSDNERREDSGLMSERQRRQTDSSRSSTPRSLATCGQCIIA